MLGYRFTEFVPNPDGDKSAFENLLNLLMQLLVYTSGDFAEAMDWLNQLDRQYGLTNDEYGMGNFLEDLKERGYIDEDEPKSGVFQITAKSAYAAAHWKRFLGNSKNRSRAAIKRRFPALVTNPRPTDVIFNLGIPWNKLL